VLRRSKDQTPAELRARRDAASSSLSPASSGDKEKIKAVIRKTGLFPEIE
jgi:hypothetical protein